MEGLAILNKGTEDVSKIEIEELIGSEGKIEDSALIFPIKDMKDLCTLCYKAQSVKNILLLLARFSFKSVGEIVKKAKSLDYSGFIGEETKVRVTCKRRGEHSFESKEVEEEVGGVLDFKVSLEQPEVVIYIFINQDRCYIGIDFAGHQVDLSKREYRVFTHSEVIKSNVAYSLLRIADYTRKDVLLDPFCGPSIIPIEAALYATGFPVNYHSRTKFSFINFKVFKGFDFDKFFEKIDKKIDLDAKAEIYAYDEKNNHIVSAKKNAKVAGINKAIRFSRTEVEWLDTKFDKQYIDKIVTRFFFSKKIDLKDSEKLLREFFYQAEFVLKKKGTICILTNNPESLKAIAVEKGFDLTGERSIAQGKIDFNVLLLKRGQKDDKSGKG